MVPKGMVPMLIQAVPFQRAMVEVAKITAPPMAIRSPFGNTPTAWTLAGGTPKDCQLEPFHSLTKAAVPSEPAARKLPPGSAATERTTPAKLVATPGAA